MAGTILEDVGAAPVVLNADGALAAGSRVRLTNVGDVASRWLMAASTPAAGMPGFPLARGASHDLTLPHTAVANLYAWAPGTCRLAINPLAGDPGIRPGPTGVVTVGPTPVVLPIPSGDWPAGTRAIALNAGALPAYVVSGPMAGPAPDPVDGIPVQPGTALEISTGPDGNADSLWWWSGWPGTTVLVTVADASWHVAKMHLGAG